MDFFSADDANSLLIIAKKDHSVSRSMRPLSAKAISLSSRKHFIDYLQGKSHTVVDPPELFPPRSIDSLGPSDLSHIHHEYHQENYSCEASRLGHTDFFCASPSSKRWDLGSCQCRLDVNPDLTEKPLSLKKPTEPQFKVLDDDNIFDKVGYEAYRAIRKVYKVKLAENDHQKKAFGDLISFIQDTITAHNITYIQKEDPHPWNMLGTIKRRLAPNDDARSLEIGQNYYKLRREPAAQSTET